MMKRDLNLLETLYLVCEDKIDHTRLNQLIELTYGFANSYIKYRYKNLSRTLMAEDITFKEMAIDAIAPLFERDEDGHLIRLSRAFNSWKPKIETEDQACFFINRLVSKSVEKYVSELLKSSDPIFSKIHRQITYLVDKQGYKKQLVLGTIYIREPEEEDISNLPDNQFIYDLPPWLFNNTKKTIKEVLNYIRTNTEKTPAIPLNAFILKIKETRFGNTGDSERTDIKNEIEIESILNLVLKTSLTKLEVTYLNKGKIDSEEYEAIERALNRLLYDLRDGGVNTGLHAYLMNEMPDLTFERYRSKYQNIFEYLFKFLRKEIAHHIKDEPES